MNPEDFYRAKLTRIYWEQIKSWLGMKETLIQKAMCAEDYYEAKRKRIFWQNMIFCVAALFILVIGCLSAYLFHKYW